jgi:hypothetical protein
MPRAKEVSTILRGILITHGWGKSGKVKTARN